MPQILMKIPCLVNAFQGFIHHAHGRAGDEPTPDSRLLKQSAAIDEAQILKYIQDTQETTQAGQQLVKKLNCHYSLLFAQSCFEDLLYQQHADIVEAVPVKEQRQGICLGLAMVWLKQRFQGKSDKQFHQSLFNRDYDASLLQVLSLQYIEQDRASNGHPGRRFEHSAPLIGMCLIAASKNQTSHAVPTQSFEYLVEKFDTLISQPPARHQGLCLASDQHAMALFRDGDESLHFFDPNNGVVSCTLANRRHLYALIYATLKLMDCYWKGGRINPNRYIFATEVQTRSQATPVFSRGLLPQV